MTPFGCTVLKMKVFDECQWVVEVNFNVLSHLSTVVSLKCVSQLPVYVLSDSCPTIFKVRGHYGYMFSRHSRLTLANTRQLQHPRSPPPVCLVQNWSPLIFTPTYILCCWTSCMARIPMTGTLKPQYWFP